MGSCSPSSCKLCVLVGELHSGNDRRFPKFGFTLIVPLVWYPKYFAGNKANSYNAFVLLVKKNCLKGQKAALAARKDDKRKDDKAQRSVWAHLRIHFVYFWTSFLSEMFDLERSQPRS